MQDFDLTGFSTHATAHYIFHYHPGSPAQRDILAIAQEQEAYFARITQELGVTPEEPLRYVLCDSPQEVAACCRALYEDVDVESLNGFADEHAVYAVYSDEVQCIGPHEDAHMIARMISCQESGALCEGLAMYFDGVWWGEANELWVRRFIADGQYVSVRELMDNDVFYAHPCEITYPIAGAFTRYAVEQAGMADFLAHVYAHAPAQEAIPRLEKLLSKPLDAIETDFLAWIHT